MRAACLIALFATASLAQEPANLVRDPALGPHESGVREQLGGGAAVLRPARLPVHVQLHQAPLREALSLLAKEGGLELVLGRGVAGRVSLSLDPGDPVQALRALTRRARLRLGRSGDVFVVSDEEPLDDDPGLPLPDRRADLPSGLALHEAIDRLSAGTGVPMAVQGSGLTATRVRIDRLHWRPALELLARDTGHQLRLSDGVWLLEPRPAALALDAASCPASSWFRLLAGAADLQLVVGGATSLPIDASLRHVDPESALRATAAANGFEATREGRIWTIHAPPAASAGLPLDTDDSGTALQRRRLAEVDRLREALLWQDPARLAHAVGRVRGMLGPPPARPAYPCQRDLRRRLRLLQEVALTEDVGPAVYDEMRQVLLTYKAAGHSRPERRLIMLLTRLPADRLSALLTRWLAAGDRLLGVLETAVGAEDEALIATTWAEIELVVDAALQGQEGESKRADTLFLAGQDLYERSVRRRYVFNHPLVLSATLVGSSPADARCVLNGEVVAIGDPIANLADGAPIAGLHLTRIEPGRIWLQIDDTVLIRGLHR